jgi:hypothetical protein
MSSTITWLGRLRSAVTPQQYIVPEATVPPYSNHTFGQVGHLGSKRTKSSKPCETIPVTSISSWLNAAGFLFSWHTVTLLGSSCQQPQRKTKNRSPKRFDARSINSRQSWTNCVCSPQLERPCQQFYRRGNAAALKRQIVPARPCIAVRNPPVEVDIVVRSLGPLGDFQLNVAHLFQVLGQL